MCEEADEEERFLDVADLPADVLAWLPTTQEECIERLAERRWGRGRFKCTRCFGNKAYRLKGRPRVFVCGYCGFHQSVTAGTFLHGTRVGLRVWYLATALVTRPEGCSATELARRTALPYPTCWRLLHRLRRALADESQPKLRGEVAWDWGKGETKRPREPEPGARWRRACFAVAHDAAGNVAAFQYPMAGYGSAAKRIAPHLERPWDRPGCPEITRAPMSEVRLLLEKTHRGVSELWMGHYLGAWTFCANHGETLDLRELLLGFALRREPMSFAKLRPERPRHWPRVRDHAPTPPRRRYRWSRPSLRGAAPGPPASPDAPAAGP